MHDIVYDFCMQLACQNTIRLEPGTLSMANVPDGSINGTTGSLCCELTVGTVIVLARIESRR